MDRRTQYTKKIIKETCIDLLLQKDIKKVTITELCKIADINRATFYRYYLDIYDLLDKMEAEFVLELKETYSKYNYKSNDLYDYVLALLKTCLNNKKFIKVLFSSKNNIYFLNDVLEDAYKRCKEKWENEVPDINEEDVEYATAYMFNGTMGVVNYWIQSDFEKDIYEITAMIKEISYYGVKRFILKNN